jgi:mannose-6-phosphate isomerase
LINSNLYNGKISAASTEVKPWGWQKIWAYADNYVGKILHINPGQRCSLKYHDSRDKTIHVLSGVLMIYLNEFQVEHTLSAGMSVRIVPKTIHRFEAPPNGEPVVLLESSTPELNDVIRLEDDYDRPTR